ncbi:NAD(P)-binding domain-containing protein, partial [Salmonella enterica subsp. enterica serovar Virginia]|nr:NAD(P)-binding domain-containing protein [Salmonella enterica subsp. enterica serovar Virginia]
KLGFIGLGIMGSPMAINLARAGHQLHVTTIGPVADELLSLGAADFGVIGILLGNLARYLSPMAITGLVVALFALLVAYNVLAKN